MKTLATVLVTAAALACAAVPPGPRRAPLPTVPEVPVLGQAWMGNASDPRLAVLTVHGVRRVDGATALYYSLGLRAEDQTGGAAFFDSYGTGTGSHSTRTARPGWPARRPPSTWRPEPPTARCARTRWGAASRRRTSTCARPQDALGRATVGWVALAPVPAGVTAVDVLVGSQIVQGVPVQDGPLEPVVDEAAPAVGTGWPRVDTARLAEVVDPEGAVFALRSQVQDVRKKVTQAKRKGSAELDLDAVVLFATDKATLTKAANAVITEAGTDHRRGQQWGDHRHRPHRQQRPRRLQPRPVQAACGGGGHSPGPEDPPGHPGHRGRQG